MKFIWTHNTGYNDIMYSTPYRPYVGAHKNIWEPIILGFQMLEPPHNMGSGNQPYG